MTPPARRSLQPFVSRLVAEWLEWDPDALHRELEGSAVFVDISGFTSMSERLARRGRVGAEEVTDVINDTFGALLTEAYSYSGGLLKFGGDALLLFFDGEDHAERATAAAHGMRGALRQIGTFETSAGKVTLRMSIGAHTGRFHLFLVGDSHRELIVTGPAASRTVEMEEAASAGQILLSPELAAVLPRSSLGAPRGPGVLLRRPPSAVRAEPVISRSDADLTRYVPIALREAVLDHGEAEHRSVTVAFLHFGDVDRMIELDGPETVALALDTLVRDVQQAIDGRGVSFLATDVARDGGKIILTAGAPQVTGSDDELMLLALRDVIAHQRRLSLQVGVNSGPVYAGEIGPSFRRTYTVMGDAVNLAARLMARAGDGEIVSSHAVLDGSRTLFATEELEPFQVKGKKRPVRAAVVGAPTGSRASLADARLPLIGRDAELRALEDAWRDAREGRGRVVGLIADPGLGKSRLLEEFLGRVGDTAVLRGECRLYQSATPYFPLRAILRTAFGLDGLTTSVSARTLAALVAERAPGLTPWLSLLGAPLELELPESDAVRQLEDRFRRARLEQTVDTLLGAVLTEPTVLLIEDTHWIDEASRELLTRLIGSVRDRPWLVIASRRPGAAGAIATDDDTPAVRIDLRPLGVDDAAALIAAATESAPLTADRIRELAERADGNPLFLIELLDALRRGEDVDTLPASVSGLIAARIDTLAPRDRRRLRELSVLGAGFRVEHTPAVLDGVEPARTIRDLADFIAVDRTGWARFRHALIRDAAYEGLSYRTRQRLHARVGDSIFAASEDPADQAELLSLHYSYARRWPEAWEYSRIAGDRAREIYANREAARFYERALSAAPHVTGVPSVEHGRVATSLCEVREQAGEFDGALDALRRARRIVGTDPVGLADLHVRRARVLVRMGSVHRAYRETTRGYRLVEPLESEGAARARAQLTAYGANLLLAEGRPRDAIRLAQRAELEAWAAGEESQLALAYVVLDEAYTDLGQRDRAVHSPKAREIYEKLGDLPRVARVENSIGVQAYAEGRWEEALAAYARVQDAYHRAGNDVHAAIAVANIGEVLVSQGRLDEAEPLLRDAIRVHRAHGLLYAALFAELQLGRLLLARGEPAEAVEMLSRVRGEAIEVAIGALELEGAINLASAYTQLGEPDRALALLDGLGSHARELHMTFAAALAKVRAEALAAQGRVDEALATMTSGLDAAREQELRFEEAQLLLVRADLVTDEDERAEALREARDLLQRLGVVFRDSA